MEHTEQIPQNPLRQWGSYDFAEYETFTSAPDANGERTTTYEIRVMSRPLAEAVLAMFTLLGTDAKIFPWEMDVEMFTGGNETVEGWAIEAEIDSGKVLAAETIIQGLYI